MMNIFIYEDLNSFLTIQNYEDDDVTIKKYQWQCNAAVSASFPEAELAQKSQKCLYTKKYDENQTDKYEFDKREILVKIETAPAGQISAQ